MTAEKVGKIMANVIVIGFCILAINMANAYFKQIDRIEESIKQCVVLTQK